MLTTTITNAIAAHGFAVVPAMASAASLGDGMD